MEDKLRTVYKFLEDNNLKDTLDLLKREIGSTRHVAPLQSTATFETINSKLSSGQHVFQKREAHCEHK